VSAASFDDLLEHVLEERSAVEVATSRPCTPLRSAARSAAPAHATGPGGGEGAAPGRGFWDRLATVQTEIGRREPALAPVTGIVGPLAAAVPIARQALDRRRAGDCEVAVLTKRAEIVSEPGWQLVRDGFRLAELVSAGTHRFLVIVIDTGPELAPWVGPLLRRLREAGMGLVRHAVDGAPCDAELAACSELLGHPLVFDLVQPVGPARVLELVERGDPIASVGGVPLTAELVVAMQAEVGRG
jgi:hypothetical protein